MVRLHFLLLTLMGLLLASCAHPSEYSTCLQEARDLAEQHPDSAWSRLQAIDPSQLLLADWCDYALLQAKTALAAHARPDAEMVHQAAVRLHRSEAERDDVAACYYYASLAYQATGDIDAAITDCMEGIGCYGPEDRSKTKDSLSLLLRQLLSSRSEAEWIDMQPRLFEGRNSFSLLPSFALAVIVSAGVLTTMRIRSRRNQQEIYELRAALQQLQAQPAAMGEVPTVALSTASLGLHLQLFQKTEAYADLQQLKYLREQMVSVHNRSRLMLAVEEAFADDVHPLEMRCPELSKEDVFLCLMSMMKFSTHDVASCLGVTDDAIRKRRSRLRKKMPEDVCAVFGV